MSKPTGYEPNAASKNAMLSDAANIAVDRHDGDEKMNLEVALPAGTVGNPHSSSTSIATSRSAAGGETVAVKRRYVEKLSSSPTKDDLYQELNEANARLLHSEGETQKVKAIMSAKCNATICSYTQSFRDAAAQFQLLSQEIFQNEEQTSKTVLEQRMQNMSALL